MNVNLNLGWGGGALLDQLAAQGMAPIDGNARQRIKKLDECRSHIFELHLLMFITDAQLSAMCKKLTGKVSKLVTSVDEARRIAKEEAAKLREIKKKMEAKK